MPDMVTDREGDHSEQIDADFVSHYRVSGKRRSGKRGLQVHFDWMGALGVDYFLCHDNLPQDYEKYPEWNVRLESLEEIMEKGEFIAGACFAIAGRHYPPDRADNPSGNTASWTLDGNVMDTVDISRYFPSDPEFVKEGEHGIDLSVVEVNAQGKPLDTELSFAYLSLRVAWVKMNAKGQTITGGQGFAGPVQRAQPTGCRQPHTN